MGYDKPWKMRQGNLSKRYTTRVEEVLVVGASCPKIDSSAPFYISSRKSLILI